MPEISIFFGIRVSMYYNDHMPPLFHAEYNDMQALVDMINSRIIKGALPSKQLKLGFGLDSDPSGRIDEKSFEKDSSVDVKKVMMRVDYFPEIVQVVPHEDRTVPVYFSDGKIVCYDMNPYLGEGIFQMIQNKQTFIDTCTIMNNTLSWDINNGDPSSCIDIDPETLYELDAVME